MTAPRVTVVSVPRERFSFSVRSLRSILEHTDGPYELVVVDGGSPRRVARQLARAAHSHGFPLIRMDRYLSPNEARNLGLAAAQTEYIVFVDNDVVVHPGWLSPLVACADENDAAVVGPLTCIGEPLGETIHFAGGEVRIIENGDGGAKTRHVKDRMWHPNRKVAKVADELKRQPCELAEFHTVLARTEVLRSIGGFDEEMLNTREHLDFCLGVARAGGSVWFEPASVVTYVPGPPFALPDIPFYMLRWSDDWERRSLQHFRQKWDLADDEFFQRRLGRLGWRRDMSLLKPFSRRVTLGRRGSGRVEAALRRPERVLNRFLTDRYRRERARSAA